MNPMTLRTLHCSMRPRDNKNLNLAVSDNLLRERAAGCDITLSRQDIAILVLMSVFAIATAQTGSGTCAQTVMQRFVEDQRLLSFIYCNYVLAVSCAPMVQG